jgi:hypothetical protein
MKRRSIVHTRPWRSWEGGTCQDRPGRGAAPNQGMELTGNSVRSSLAPARPSSSCPALGVKVVHQYHLRQGASLYDRCHS